MITEFKIFEDKYDDLMEIGHKLSKFMVDFLDYIDLDVEFEEYRDGHYVDDIEIIYDGISYISMHIRYRRTQISQGKFIHMLFTSILESDLIDSEFGDWKAGKIVSDYLIKIFTNIMREIGHTDWILTDFEFPIKYVDMLIDEINKVKDEIKIKIEAEKYNL